MDKKDLEKYIEQLKKTILIYVKKTQIALEPYREYYPYMVAGIVLVLFWIFYSLFQSIKTTGTIEYRTGSGLSIDQAKMLSCEVRFSKKTVEGDSMEPFIKNGQELLLLEDFYKACNEKPKVWDIVAHRYGGQKHALIKAVRATDEDEIEVLQNALKINGSLLKNSAGQTYIFTPGELNLINLYIRDRHIPKDSYLLFGDNVSNSIDSRKFGAVSLEDFLGKFVQP